MSEKISNSEQLNEMAFDYAEKLRETPEFEDVNPQFIVMIYKAGANGIVLRGQGEARPFNAMVSGKARDVNKYIDAEDKHFTLDDDTVHIYDFLVDNAEALTKKELREIAEMQPGDEISFGGGAAGLSTLKRIK